MLHKYNSRVGIGQLELPNYMYHNIFHSNCNLMKIKITDGALSNYRQYILNNHYIIGILVSKINKL